MRYIYILVMFLSLFFLYGYVSPAPPKINDKSTYNYTKTLYERLNTLTVVTSTPNGSRNGKYGNMVLLNNSGTYYIEICTSSPSGTVWKGVVLSATP